MSDQHKWRPPVAPKPHLPLSKGVGSNGVDASAALRGAAAAFAPIPNRSIPQQHASGGALNAAGAAAERSRREHIRQDDSHLQSQGSPTRGRSQLSLDLQQASERLAATALQSQRPRPAAARAASEIAARAASASTSPHRAFDTNRGLSVSRPPRSDLSRESSTSQRSRDRSESDAREALLGATASMVSSPASDAHTPIGQTIGKLDFGKIPYLIHVQASSGLPRSNTGPSNSSLAARSASKGAERRAAVETQGANRTFAKPHMQRTLTDNAAFSSSRAPIQAKNLSSRVDSESPPELAHASEKISSRPIPVPLRQVSKYAPRSPSAMPESPQSRGRLTASNLADAMVGASLATSRVHSRNVSPVKGSKPPVPRKRSRSHSQMAQPFHHQEEPRPLKPLPARPMRQTLRKQVEAPESDDESRKHRKHRLRKHPNQHNEGDRKRWRDKITERERKRYEGVWAANRGVLHDYEVPELKRTTSKTQNVDDLVLNVVVREIWDRSRLPPDILAEIWVLVSDEETKSLNREQFVVGLWLVDQRLKGRKLPVRVSPSVWSSVRHIQGVKVSRKPL